MPFAILSTSRFLFSCRLVAPNAVVRCRAMRRNYVAGQLADLQNKIGLHYHRPFEDVRW